MAKFTDTAGNWAEKIINRAAELGIVTGFEDGSFQPAKPVTRAEAAVIAVRLYDALSGK